MRADVRSEGIPGNVDAVDIIIFSVQGDGVCRLGGSDLHATRIAETIADNKWRSILILLPFMK